MLFGKCIGMVVGCDGASEAEDEEVFDVVVLVVLVVSTTVDDEETFCCCSVDIFVIFSIGCA